MITLRRSAIRGVASLLEEIRRERAAGEVFTACTLVFLLVASSALLGGVAVLMAQGLWWLVWNEEWLWLALIGAMVQAARVVWRVTAP